MLAYAIYMAAFSHLIHILIPKTFIDSIVYTSFWKYIDEVYCSCSQELSSETCGWGVGDGL